MLRSKQDFQSAIGRRAGAHVDTSPIVQQFLSSHFGVTADDIADAARQKTISPPDVRLTLSQHLQSLSIAITCPNRSGSRNAAEVTCLATPADRQFEIKEIIVDPAQRSLGWGRRLVVNTIDIADTLDMNHIHLTASRTHGPFFWAKLGAEPAAKPDFDVSFRSPLAERFSVLAPYLDTASKQAASIINTIPAKQLPAFAAQLDQDVRSVLEQPGPIAAAPSFAVVTQYRPDTDEVRGRAFANFCHDNLVHKHTGALPLGKLLLTWLPYDAQIDLNNQAQRRRIDANLTAPNLA